MCLNKLSKTKPPESGFFYKVFVLMENGRLEFSCQAGCPRRGVWIKKEGSRIDALYFTYPAGFHGFVKKLDADLYAYRCEGKVIKVKYRKAHTLGTQYSGDVIVADEILIPRRKPSKPKKNA